MEVCLENPILLLLLRTVSLEGEGSYSYVQGNRVCGYVWAVQGPTTKRGAHNNSNVPLTLKTKIPKLLIYPNKPNNYFNFLKS